MFTIRKSSHIAFQFEKEEAFFELGYKVLVKQQIAHTLPGICVKYNLQDRILYSIEEMQSLEECFVNLNEQEVRTILISLLQVMKEVEQNGFIPLEALQIGMKYIFWNTESKMAKFIVLPISKECESEDYRNWNKRFIDFIYDLIIKLDKHISELVIDCLGRSGRIIDQVSMLLPLLEQKEVAPTERNIETNQSVEMELQLIHNGTYGQFILYDRKNEYVIGKRRDSVDGLLTISDAVSRIHCKIIRHGNQFYIKDLNSSNHTYVNSIMVNVQEERQLYDGCRVRIADVDFVVRIVYW